MTRATNVFNAMVDYNMFYEYWYAKLKNPQKVIPTEIKSILLSPLDMTRKRDLSKQLLAMLGFGLEICLADLCLLEASTFSESTYDYLICGLIYIDTSLREDSHGVNKAHGFIYFKPLNVFRALLVKANLLHKLSLSSSISTTTRNLPESYYTTCPYSSLTESILLLKEIEMVLEKAQALSETYESPYFELMVGHSYYQIGSDIGDDLITSKGLSVMRRGWVKIEKYLYSEKYFSEFAFIEVIKRTLAKV
jgi:hypothetical protein